jgi:chromatin segregation and condensation protein Rec8/ScpA/Scc1 (kleisin family)
LLGRDVFAAPGEKVPEEQEPSAPFEVSIFDLVSAMAAVLKRIGDRTPRRIELRDIPVAQCIPRILAALGDGERVEFTTLFEDLADRPLVIATFMALLELIRRGAVRAWQEDRQGPILLGRGDRFAAHEAIVADEGDTVGVADSNDVDGPNKINEEEERGE